MGASGAESRNREGYGGGGGDALWEAALCPLLVCVRKVGTKEERQGLFFHVKERFRVVLKQEAGRCE